MHEAVVLLGGFGTRLKSVTGDIPKPMVDVAGQPFVYRVLRQLERSGFNRIILSLHYKADYIRHRISTDKPVDCEIIFVVEDEPLGTGGGLKLAAAEIQGEKFLALNGDTYCDLALSPLREFSKNKKMVVVGVRVDDAARYGALIFDSESRLISFLEKDANGPAFINSGVYSLSKSEILDFHLAVFSLEKDFFPHYGGEIFVYCVDNYFIDIGVPEDFRRACRDFQ